MIARLAQSATLGILDHFSHFTLFELKKNFAKKNAEIRDKRLTAFYSTGILNFPGLGSPR